MEPASIPLVSPIASNVLLDSTEAVPTEETDLTLDQDPEPINPSI
jgi:hypothetical protein